MGLLVLDVLESVDLTFVDGWYVVPETLGEGKGEFVDVTDCYVGTVGYVEGVAGCHSLLPFRNQFVVSTEYEYLVIIYVDSST